YALLFYVFYCATISMHYFRVEPGVYRYSGRWILCEQGNMPDTCFGKVSSIAFRERVRARQRADSLTKPHIHTDISSYADNTGQSNNGRNFVDLCWQHCHPGSTRIIQDTRLCNTGQPTIFIAYRRNRWPTV